MGEETLHPATQSPSLAIVLPSSFCYNSLKKDIIKLYEGDKEKLDILLRKDNSRISLTTDILITRIIAVLYTVGVHFCFL